MSYQSTVSGLSPDRYYRLQDALTDEQGGSAMVRGASAAQPQFATGYVDSSPRGLSFDGGDGAYIPNVAAGGSVASIAYFFKPTSFSGTQVLFEQSSQFNSAKTPADFVIYSDGSAFTIAVADNFFAAYDSQTYPLPATGTWVHHVITFNRSASGAARIKFYVNGVLQTPTTGSYAGSTAVFASGQSINVGCRAGGTLNVNGVFDDIAFWGSTELSAANVTALYGSISASLSRTAADSWAWSESLSRTTTSGTSRTASDSWAWTDTAPRTRRQNVTVGQGYPGGEVYPGGQTYPGGIGDHWAWYETATRGAVVHGGLARNAFADTWTWADAATRTTSTVRARTSTDAWAWADSAGGPAYSLTTITHDTHTVAGTGGLTSTTTANQVTVAEISGTSPIPA